MSNKLFTTSEAATFLNCSREAVVDWFNQGEFPNAFKLNPNARNSPIKIPEGDVYTFKKKRDRNSPNDDVSDNDNYLKQKKPCPKAR